MSREHALIEELLHENDVLRLRYREACREWDQQMQSIRETVKNEFQQKVDVCRQRWQMDKAKEQATIKEQMQSDFDQRLNTLVKIKEKEIRQLRAQLTRMQQTAARTKTQNSGSKLNLYDSRTSFKGSFTGMQTLYWLFIDKITFLTFLTFLSVLLADYIYQPIQ